VAVGRNCGGGAGFRPAAQTLLVVDAAGIVHGLAAGLDLVAVIAAFGKEFNDNRYIGVLWLVLPAIGALIEQVFANVARDLIAAMRFVTVFR
jgi:uncharacterized membrane protein